MKFMRRTNPPGGGTVVWMQSSLAAGRAEGAVRCVQKFRELWRGGATRRALKIEANQPISLRVAGSAPISRHVWYDKQSYGVVLRVYRGAGIRIGVDRVCFVRADGKRGGFNHAATFGMSKENKNLIQRSLWWVMLE